MAQLLDRIRLTGRSGAGKRLSARVEALEREVHEQRALNRRIAELTDVVTELLLPLHERDGELAHEILDRYRDRI